MHLNRLLLEYPFIWGGSLVGGSPVEAEHLLFEISGEENWGTSMHFDVVLMLAVKALTSPCAFI